MIPSEYQCYGLIIGTVHQYANGRFVLVTRVQGNYVRQELRKREIHAKEMERNAVSNW